jgi:hypothetical protein
LTGLVAQASSLCSSSLFAAELLVAASRAVA